MISVLIPTLNGGEELRECLRALNRQVLEQEMEILVLDSGSGDHSVQIAQAEGARVLSIPQGEFSHGRARNQLARAASGELLVFLSQDAIPQGVDFLARLLAPLQERRVAGVYGRQQARVGAPPPEQFFLAFMYGEKPRVQEARGPEQLSMESTLFSNVCSALRRTELLEQPFAEDLIMSEDQEWSARMLLQGRLIIYQPDALVIHSHTYTLARAFKRFFDSGVSASRAYLAGEEGELPRASAVGKSVLRDNALRYAREELRWLVRSRQMHWLPYTLVYELSKFLGLQMGIRYHLLPSFLIRRCTGMPLYWRAPRQS